MSVKARPVSNSANLAMFMVNVAQALMRPMRAQWPAFSVHDLKAWFRGWKYVVETLQLLPEPPDHATRTSITPLRCPARWEESRLLPWASCAKSRYTTFVHWLHTYTGHINVSTISSV